MPSKILVGLSLGVARNIEGCLQIKKKNLGANLNPQTLNINIAKCVAQPRSGLLMDYK